MILFLILLVGMAWFLQKEMGKHALRQLSCSLRCEDYLAEPDSPVPMVFTVENRSRIPVLFLRCSCSVPLEAELAQKGRGRIMVLAKSAEYRFNCFLLPHQCLVHRFYLSIPKRGGYRMGNLHLAAGDFFGLKEEEVPFPGSCEVVIMPRKPEKSLHTQVTGGLLGERSVRRWIHEDPVLSAGFREYTGREPLKTVNWNRSLQSGKLMVRQMDHTAEEKVTVLFSQDDCRWGEYEQLYSLCRGVCEDLEAQGLPFVFLHNGYLQTAVGILPPLEAGVGRLHLNRILEGLGRAVPGNRESLGSLVRRTLLRSQDSCCYLLVVPRVTPEVRRQSARLEATGGGAVKILCPEVQP